MLTTCPHCATGCQYYLVVKGNEIVNFGKYKGKPVREVLQRDPGYYGWMIQGNFTLNTKQTLTRLRLKYAIR